MFKHRFKRTKKIIRIVLLLAIGGIFYSLSFTTYEHIKVNKTLNAFMSKATLVNQYENNVSYHESYEGHITRMYEVPRETSFQRDGRNVFSDATKSKIGQKGDIFVTRQSPFPNIPIFHQFMSFYYGGHAAFYDGNRYIEATGYPSSVKEFFQIVTNKGNDPDHGLGTTAKINKNRYWDTLQSYNHYYNGHYRSEYIGLRIKDADEEMINSFINSAQEKIENNSLYNFLFFINMKYKYYCTDLVSRAYEEAFYRTENKDPTYHSKGYAKKLNDDGFITSVNDLILSKDSYIHFYVKVTKENNQVYENIYYLEDIEEVDING